MAQQPIEHWFQSATAKLCYFEWNAETRPRQPTVLLVHATGFHARCWDQVVARLPGRHVIAVDMRGHGRSSNDGPITWDQFGEDLAALIAHLQLQAAIGVGHSMGGHCLVQAAAEMPQAFCQLLLIDPVILAPEVYDSGPFEGIAEHPTAKRRNAWASWQEMFERFATRKPFAAWDPDVLEDYCRHGLVPAEEGEGYQLACPPQVEAAIYLGSSANDIYQLVRQVQTPTTILRARERSSDGERDPMDFSASPTWPGLVREFPQACEEHLVDHSHFIPMEAPQLVADRILALEALCR